MKDLEKIKNKNIVTKYYICKIHYFNDCNNDDFELGDPYHIYDIGYFYIGGFMENEKVSDEVIKTLFDDYDKKYNYINFPFDDKEFLSFNK